jgi:hypothetical protein
MALQTAIRALYDRQRRDATHHPIPSGPEHGNIGNFEGVFKA